MGNSADELRGLSDRAFTQWQSLEMTWKRRTLRNRSAARLFAFSSVILSVVATAISGIPTVPRWWIVIASSGATLAVALRNTTKAHEQWVFGREVLNRLYAERFLFEQSAGPYAGLAEDERTRLFSTRIIEIVMAGHDSWASNVANAVDALNSTETSALR
ncbi:DUF4231 domain-containing protein [Streptomyces sp. NPDC002586]|uniref:DUF4231 domain-containing protein n=1 Tax=Streptomyces sp. NPDC002589 TaxID=3154420 RepID=UPI00331B3DDB